MDNYSKETQTLIPSGVKKYIDINKFAPYFYDLLAVIHCLFEHADIEYWIDGGTLLGAIRHKGMIPWDDDLDIMAPCKDFNNFVHRIAPILEKLGYKCVVFDEFVFGQYKDHPIFGQNKFVKVIIPSELVTNKAANERLFIDIFFAVEHEGKMYPFGEAFHPFPAIDLWPLRKDYQFGPITVWGPHNPKNYLKKLYSGWEYTATLGMNHIRQGQEVLDKGDGVSITLTEELCQPAKPFGELKMLKQLLEMLSALPTDEELPYVADAPNLPEYDPTYFG